MINQMTPRDLGAALKDMSEAANHYHDQIEELQDQAFEYYEAGPNGHEVEGRSQLVMPDVQEVLDDTAAALLRMFVSGDRTVEFEAVNEEDEQAADDATSAIEYNFMRKQDGYGVLNDVIQDGNLRKLGVFKTVSEKKERVSRRWELVPVEGLPLVEAEFDVEDVRLVQETDPETGQSVEMARVLIKEEKSEYCYNLVAVPDCEFRFCADARHEDEADFLSHAKPTTRSDLVGMGFDRDQVYRLPEHSERSEDKHKSDRLDHSIQEQKTEALQRVLLCEDYARIDVDGDGIAELVKAYRVDGEVLRWQGEPILNEVGEQEVDEYGEPLFEDGDLAIETVDEQPFSIFCPFPRPHRIIGYSLADKIMDIQLARTQLLRQLMDGMMLTNLPRHEVVESGVGDHTYDDLLNPVAGGVVRVKSQGAVTAMQSNFNVGQTLQVIEFFSREKEARSGSGRSVPTAGEDSLNNQTATEFLGREGKSETLQEYIARNLAEAFARGCAKLYRLMRVEAEPFRIKVDGKYRMVDPSSWPEDMNMRVRVGLGSGSKDKRISARMAMQQPLIMSFQEGMSGPEHLFKWMDGTARDMQLGTGEDFMNDPSDPEVAARLSQKEDEPSPEVIEAQGKVQVERERVQFDAEMRAFEMQSRLELEAYKIEGQIDLAAYKAQVEAGIAEMKAKFEASRKVNLTDQRMGGSIAS